jgi:hypothetical protein
MDLWRAILRFNVSRFWNEMEAAMNPDWYLLADFTQSDEPAGDLAMQQVTAAVDDFDLPPAYLERVRRAVAGAVSKALRDSAGGPVSVRIYVSSLDQMGQGKSHSWGFFLVEKRSDEASVDRESPALMELFLYAEEDGA